MNHPYLPRHLQLATEPVEQVTPPDRADELDSNFHYGEYPPYVTKVIGNYRPKSINMADRIRMRNQPDVAFMSALVRGPIVNMRWTFESEDDELAAAMDALIRPEYVTLAKAASLGMFYGFQVIQPIFESKPFTFEVEDKALGESKTSTLPMAWVPKRYKSIDPRTITLVADPKTDELDFVSQDGLDGKTRKVDAEHLVFWSFRNEDDWGRLTGNGIADDAYTPAYDQAALTLMRNRYFERRADPTPVAYAERGKLLDKNNKSIDGYQLMRDELGAWRNGSFMVLPGLRDDKGNRVYSVEYLTDDKRGDMYQQVIDAEGVKILKCGLIPGEAATSEPMGSRARAEVHENRLGEIQQTHVDEWRRVFQAYARRVAIYNFGLKRVEAGGLTCKASGLSPGMQALYKEVLNKILDAEAVLDQGGTLPLRKRIDGVGMCDDLELPLRPLEDAQKEWDQEQAERDAKAAAIAAGQGSDVPIKPGDERAIADELARTGITEE